MWRSGKGAREAQQGVSSATLKQHASQRVRCENEAPRLALSSVEPSDARLEIMPQLDAAMSALPHGS